MRKKVFSVIRFLTGRIFWNLFISVAYMMCEGLTSSWQVKEQAGQSEGVGVAWCICRRGPEMAVIAGVVED